MRTGEDACGRRLVSVWGGFGKYDRLNYRSLLQKSPIKETIFCKKKSYN